MEGNHGSKKTGTAVVANPVRKVKHASEKEVQATSDAQLNQALIMLKGLQSQMPASHPKAAHHVSEAINNLTTALNIK